MSTQPMSGSGDDIPHGYYAYASLGCRCDVCRSAKAEYMRQRRRAAREQAALFTQRLKRLQPRAGVPRHYVQGVKHGSSYAYYERGCRCFECTDWEVSDTVARRHRQAGK